MLSAAAGPWPPGVSCPRCWPPCQRRVRRWLPPPRAGCNRGTGGASRLRARRQKMARPGGLLMLLLLALPGPAAAEGAAARQAAALAAHVAAAAEAEAAASGDGDAPEGKSPGIPYHAFLE